MRPPWLDPLWENNVISLGGTVVLTNVGVNYDTINAAKGLGLAQVDFTNVKRIDLGVFVNKVGNGTQSWQLWNVTDGAEIMVINDAAGTGDKLLEANITTGIPVGVKVVRVRVKSTSPTDDPIYYGSYLILS